MACTLSDRDLSRIIKLVYDRSGITLHEGKRALVMARLQKRVKAGGFADFGVYLKAVEQDRSGDEIAALLDSIATNHTYFFREAQHFSWLVDHVVPEFRTKSAGPLRIWNAACSTGEEPYTIGISLLRAAPPCEFTMLASDLSTRALQRAQAGVYKLQAVEAIERPILRQFFERGLGEQEGLARVTAGLRRRIEYRKLNLLEIGSLGETFDVIFCRNVMIYFDRPVQQRVVATLERHLRPGGTLFIAHSESLNGVEHALQWTAPAVYRKPSGGLS